MSLAGFWRLFSLLDQEYDPDDETLRARIVRMRYRADVVDPLPAAAPVGYLMVHPPDPFLYVGRGPGNKLARAPLELVP